MSKLLQMSCGELTGD